MTQTTITTYLYNADGAPTAVTTQVDTQAPSTVYLTWDNFTPNTADPTTGTLSAANGNLLGYGPNRGTAGLSPQFQYDQRDRLTGCSVTGHPAVSYTYYPASQMATSALASGDALQFYYALGKTPLVTDMHQSSTGLMVNFLGPLRHLSDGTQQVLLQPRKDTAAAYDPAAQTVAAYRYDPYGAPQSATAQQSGLSPDGSSYDLAQNPFQYAGEYKDPVCDAYYLRARWYLPAQQTFLSRDRGDPLHRYSYTAGNPVGHTDPSGLHRGESGAGKFLRDLHANGNGLRGSLSRVFLGGVIGIAQIIANPSGYWHALKHDTGGIDIFLAAGVLAEVGTTGWGILPELPGSALASFGARHAVDATLGIGQSVASGFNGHRRFDWAAVGQGMEYTAGGMFWGRETGGIGYKPYGMTADDVTELAKSHFGSSDTNDILVFRVRGPLIVPAFGTTFNLPRSTSPLAELGHVGFYHESLVGVLRDYDPATGTESALKSFRIETNPVPIRDTAGKEIATIYERLQRSQSGVGIGPVQRAMFVGRYTQGLEGFLDGLDYRTGDNDFRPSAEYRAHYQETGTWPSNPYWLIGNNCQNFSARIRGALGLR